MELGNCKRLSVMINSIRHLPPIKAPHLQALFLNDNNRLTTLPSDIFAGMKLLKTLDLSDSQFTCLPPSLSCLQQLRTLLLEESYLRDVSPIEKLERLEVLSLRNSKRVQKLPEEMINLSNLRILDLTGTSLVHTNPNLISKSHLLEAFHLFTSNVYPFEDRETQLLHEVGSLSRLTSFEILFHNPEVCHIEIHGLWEKLTRFKIMVNSHLQRPSFKDRQSSFLRSLCLEVPRKEVANWVLVLLGRTNYLKLQNCCDLRSVTELGAKGMNDNLKYLTLKECRKMEFLVENMGLIKSDENAFSNLEELKIKMMGAFVEICMGTPPSRLLSKLKTLTFKFCNSLVTAIPRKLIQNLLNLEYLEIMGCGNLLYVVGTKQEEESKSKISEPLPAPIFPNLKKFEITETKIRYVFSMKVARSLLQLEELQIQGCEEMEVIFKYADGEDDKCHEDGAILPRLKKLTVVMGTKLISITTQDLLLEFPSLEYLTVYECEILERLPFGTTSVPNLKKVTAKLDFFDTLEWEDESVKSRLQKVHAISSRNAFCDARRFVRGFARGLRNRRGPI